MRLRVVVALFASLPTMHATAAGAFLGKQLSDGSSAPRIGLGLAALGRPGYINLNRDSEFSAVGEQRTIDAMEKHCHAVLDGAYAAGVRYFDCARSYGESERFLASWLAARGFGPGDVVCGSKWGYRYTAGWRVDTGGEPHEVKDHSVEHLRSQTAETSSILGGHVDLYQIHSATLESGVLDNAEVLAELRAMKRERGWRIGLSVSGPKQAEVIRKALSVDPPLFDCVQATYNLLEQSAGAALAEARAAGLDVIVKEAMANGRLLAQGTSAAESVRTLAAELETTPDALCLAAVMSQPFTPLVLSGAATPEQAASNAQAMRVAQSPALAARLEQLMAACAVDSAAYWAERSALQWN